MMVLFFILVAINSACFGAEEAFNGHLKSLDALGAIEEVQQIKYCLFVGRKTLEAELKKNLITAPENLTEYDYKYNSSDDQYKSLISAKVQIADTKNIALIWRFKNKPLNFNYKGMMHTNEWIDAAISADGNYVAGITKDARLEIRKSVGTDLNPVFLSDQMTSDVLQKAVVVWKKSKVVPQYLLVCSLNGKLLNVLYDAASERVTSVQTVMDFKERAVISELSFVRGREQNLLLMAAIVEPQKEKSYRSYDLNTNEKVDAPQEQFNIECNKRVGTRVMLLDTGTEHDGLRTISAHDIATYRGLNNVENYFALDINVACNRVALLSTASRETVYYVPKIDIADFAPKHIVSVIKKFNRAIKSTKMTGDEVRELLKEIVYAVNKEKLPTEQLQPTVVPEQSIIPEQIQQPIMPMPQNVPQPDSEVVAAIAVMQQNQPVPVTTPQQLQQQNQQTQQPQLDQPLQQSQQLQQLAVAPAAQPTPAPQAPKSLLTRWSESVWHNVSSFGTAIKDGFSWLGRRFSRWFGFS